MSRRRGLKEEEPLSETSAELDPILEEKEVLEAKVSKESLEMEVKMVDEDMTGEKEVQEMEDKEDPLDHQTREDKLHSREVLQEEVLLMLSSVERSLKLCLGSLSCRLGNRKMSHNRYYCL